MFQESSGRVSLNSLDESFSKSIERVRDVLADTLKFGSHCRTHGERKTEVAHLAEVAIPCIMAQEIEVEVSGKSPWHTLRTENERAYCISGEESPDFGRTRTIVRYEWLSRWTFPYPSVRSYGLPDIFDARNFHRTISPCPTYRRDYVRENARSLE